MVSHVGTMLGVLSLPSKGGITVAMPTQSLCRFGQSDLIALHGQDVSHWVLSTPCFCYYIKQNWFSVHVSLNWPLLPVTALIYRGFLSPWSFMAIYSWFLPGIFSSWETLACVFCPHRFAFSVMWVESYSPGWCLNSCLLSFTRQGCWDVRTELFLWRQ